MRYFWTGLAVACGLLLFVLPVFAADDTVWLSDLNLKLIRQGYKTARKDLSVEGHRLTIGGKEFQRGIGTHAISFAEVALKGKATRFHAWVGVDDEARNDEGHNMGSVEFQLYADKQLLWKSGVMHGGDAAKEVDLPLNGYETLIMIVTEDGDGNGFDHADWADATITAPGAAPSIEIISSDQPIILTPKPAKTPRINGAKVFGVRPGSPVLYTIAATGARPMTFSADGLPSGLTLDGKTGRITGALHARGENKITLHAKNAIGEATCEFRIVVGDRIALTPPMGWNRSIRAAADAFVKYDLINHGWTYINMDDGWQAYLEKGSAGTARIAPGYGLQANDKFPDMKALADYVHGKGLKVGLYSTPWMRSYAGFTGGSAKDASGAIDPQGGHGAVGFEKQDAKQWAEWGFDYLKYDWNPIDVPHVKAMSDALHASGRDIVYSLSNSADYNQRKDWAKLAEVWRTTGDINDSWGSMSDIGFSQSQWGDAAGPGHWNDPDMLVVGNVGWGSPHPSGLTPNEQYTHISLWCLVSAPLLIGCDLSHIDDFTLNLLTNDEVLEVDQDPLGEQAKQVKDDAGLQVWAKPMEDGSIAVGLFNTRMFSDKVTAKWSDIGAGGPQRVRDLWRQKDLGTFDNEYSVEVPRHGVVLIRIWPGKNWNPF